MTKASRDWLRASGGLLAINVGHVLANGTTLVLLANSLGAHAFGVFAFAQAVGGFVPLLAGLGGEQVLLMFGSVRASRVRHLLGTALLVRAVASTVILAGIAAVLAVSDYSETTALVTVGSALAVAAVLDPLLFAYYRVLGRFYTPALLGLGGRIGMLVVVAAGGAPDLTRAVLWFLASYLAPTIVCLFLAVGHGLGISRRAIAKTWRMGLWFSVSQMADFLSARLDTIIIQLLLGASAVGVYNAGYRLTAILLIIPSAVHMVMQPTFYRVAANRQEIRVVFRRTRAFLVAAGAALSGLLILGSTAAANLLFNAEYDGVDRVMQLTSILMFIHFASYPYSMLAEALGLVRQRFLLRLAAIALSALTASLLASYFGLIGVAWGMVIGAIGFMAALHRLIGPAITPRNEVAPDPLPIRYA